MERWQKTYGSIRLAMRIAAFALVRRRRRVDLAARLASFPRDRLAVCRPVRIGWNDHQVPFVEAETDRDLAVALGAIHAHLRFAQIAFMRRIALGRLSEVLGAIAFDLDHTLRIMNFAQASRGTLAVMPGDTRAWIEGFVEGLNAAAEPAQASEELALFGVREAPWTAEHVVAVGRLAAVDFSWRVWHRLRVLRDRPDWTHLWRRILDARAAPVPNLAGSGWAAETVEAFWGSFGRSGSNAAAVSAARSVSGGALLASDPHLSIMAPGNWLAAGMRSPGVHAVGLMIPSLPVVALGRTPWIAWSGTSLHAASSDLFDVSEVPAADIREREEVIRVRWDRARRVRVRESDCGPIVSDAPLLRSPDGRALALTWIGHRASDETTSMLAMMRARTWDDFTHAIEGFAAPAQNLVFADAAGGVGQAMAAHLPRRPHAMPADLVLPPEEHASWHGVVTARDLPRRYAPAEGFVASANNRPEEETPVPVGFFFSPEERIARLRSLLGGGARVSLDDLRALQRDVAMPSALAMRDLLLGEADGADDPPAAQTRALLAALRAWDGRHGAESEGALAFELFLYHFIRGLHGDDGMALYRGTLAPWDLLREDVAHLGEEALHAAAHRAAAAAAETFAKHRRWGAVHRVRLAHPLARLPLFGRRYVFREVAAGGSNETLMKTAHGLSDGPHIVRFGANARFLADMGDLDETYVVLLGGQDGWLGSTTFADQFDMWQRGEDCRLPLRPETVRAEFRHRTDAIPRAPGLAGGRA